MGSETISWTAHYTGYVWFANGLSHEAFATSKGRALYRAMRAANVVAERIGAPTLDGMLLGRHELIDLRLARAIDAGEVSQIIEVAAGMSPRGWRFREQYGSRITYVEADLPEMRVLKQEALADVGGETKHHYTAEVDALADAGPSSIASLCASLDPARGTAIITEGLVNYFTTPTLLGMWTRFARALARFPHGIYLSDLITQEHNSALYVRAFGKLLARATRANVTMHFATDAEAVDALGDAGFDGALLAPKDFARQLHGVEMRGADRVRIVEAVARRA
ncbi:MAG TPA: class I SAM-dependent methyltransferase [Kofleriaceae bacterium]|jgi:O-methyltransferase involved in polyketide biosynthesis